MLPLVDVIQRIDFMVFLPDIKLVVGPSKTQLSQDTVNLAIVFEAISSDARQVAKYV